MKNRQFLVLTLLALTMSAGFFACTKSQDTMVLDPAANKKPAAQEAKKITNKEGLPTYLFYYATWCGYCEKMAPNVMRAEKEYDGKVYFYYVDIDSDYGKKVAELYKGPRGGVPHAQFYDKDGNLLDQELGLVSYERLKKKLITNFKL